MSAKKEPPPGILRERLVLECCCQKQQVLYVSPEARVQSVAKAHGWGLHAGQWECATCAAVRRVRHEADAVQS